ncbi:MULTISPECIES: ectonucleotide pyrophosphatase/phosphodiesterase [Pseudoxanthomonas]|uniref:Putative AlkP superfamily pyrophosphatase or phosphodiesterase n=1 Tax=Pseudoxanthomonas taiwanensis J19 TaxID=935569 RepID=A0A562D0Y9_9GAMM|nr:MULTISPECIES: ectonucleotide pyrophosphatase/phosphodiesterase [Pseudoxanthomonas]TWH03232.1 putative AlkP superfamily pyrophosphatase or phosphodiesterase [Pseudoxanthomonas taiwanensis J19]
MSCLPRLGAFLFLLLSLAACAAAPARTAKEPAYTPLLLVSVDGLRADALGRGDTPVLDALAREGVQAEGMRPSFPALTFPNHYTLVTGLRPDHHGVVHNSMKDPQLGRFVVADKQAATVAGWWQAEPLWTTAERAGIATAVWAWPGATAERDGVLPRQGQAFDANIPLDERVERVAAWVAAPQGPRPGLVAMYFEMVDGAGHDHGPGSEQARAAIRTVDAAIGQLLARLETAGVVPNVVVVSDHGMADARNFLAVEDIAAMEEAEVVSIGQVIGLVPRAGYGDALRARLPGRHAQYQCWEKERIPARLHYGSHPRIPPIVCQMDEGWNALPRAMIERRNAEGRRDAGAHGYDPDLPSMRAVFLAHGPAFRRGLRLPVFDNVDVYPLLARLVGVQPQPGDGNPQTLLPALQAP